jgi:hypothetical protein
MLSPCPVNNRRNMLPADTHPRAFTKHDRVKGLGVELGSLSLTTDFIFVAQSCGLSESTLACLAAEGVARPPPTSLCRRRAGAGRGNPPLDSFGGRRPHSNRATQVRCVRCGWSGRVSVTTQRPMFARTESQNTTSPLLPRPGDAVASGHLPAPVARCSFRPD